MSLKCVQKVITSVTECYRYNTKTIFERHLSKQMLMWELAKFKLEWHSPKIDDDIKLWYPTILKPSKKRPAAMFDKVNKNFIPQR